MEFENGSLKARKAHDIVFWNEYEYMYHTSCCSGSVDLCNTAYSPPADLSVEYRIVIQISLKNMDKSALRRIARDLRVVALNTKVLLTVPMRYFYCGSSLWSFILFDFLFSHDYGVGLFEISMLATLLGERCSTFSPDVLCLVPMSGCFFSFLFDVVIDLYRIWLSGPDYCTFFM